MSQSAAQGTISGRRHQVVVIGSGFGGLFATQSLKHADALSTREILGCQRNARVLLGEVKAVDLANGQEPPD